MSNFDLFFERMVQEDMQFIEALLGPTQDVVGPFNEYIDKEIEKRQKCEQNNKPYEVDWSKIDEFMEKYEKARKLSSQLISKFNSTLVSTTDDDAKENTPTEEEKEIPALTSTVSSTTANGRPKRAAFREASQMINKQVNVKLNNKLRREDVSEEKSSLVVDIKTERQSARSKKIDDNKKNDMDEMPPPKSLPIKKRTNRRIKKEQLDMSVIPEDELSVDVCDIKQEKEARNSDVVIQEPKISLVDLTISSSTITTTTTSAEPNNNNDDSKRGTYAIDKNVKTKQTSEKRIRDVIVDDDSVEKSSSKRAKSNATNDKNNDSTSTYYDDATSNVEHSDLINATFITGPSFKENTNKKLMNTTVVVQKNQQFPNIPDGLLTDDESDNEQQSKSNTKHVKSSKQVFSAFEQSPVKKKVEAFEKLNAPPVDNPVRVTRTKTKALEKQQEQQPSAQRQQNVANNSTKLLPVNNVKEKAKLFTSPTPKSLQKTVKKLQTTTTAANKTKVGETHQKENDAKEKREARIQQMIEERRRKREEKELKAQQQREIIEREKLKQLEEQERLKEERYKRLLLEQEQRKQKQREEIERKRLLTREKAQKQKEQQAVEKPKYLTMETPRLPTDDCYDSDEENYHKIQIQVPTWCKDENICRTQFTITFCGEKIKNAFFSREAQTVDLKHLFQTNNPRILKRTSSAHWTKPPKYSILPTHLENSVECSEDSGDD